MAHEKKGEKNAKNLLATQAKRQEKRSTSLTPPPIVHIAPPPPEQGEILKWRGYEYNHELQLHLIRFINRIH